MSVRHTLYGSFRVVHTKIHEGRWPKRAFYRIEDNGNQRHLDVHTIAFVCRHRGKCEVTILDDGFPAKTLATETWYPEQSQ